MLALVYHVGFNDSMIKTGFEYANSKQKRSLDLTFAYSLTPIFAISRLIVGRRILESDRPDLGTLFEQPRIGKNSGAFDIKKLQTLDPDTKESLGDWADALRRLGLDELGQIDNIKDGSMSAVGWRPTEPEETQETLDVLPPSLRSGLQKVMKFTNPGGISSYAIYHHVHPEADPNEAEIRATLNIKDAWQGNLVYDLGLMTSLATTAIGRRLT